VVMMTSRTPWSSSRRRSVGAELVVRVKSIVVEVRCSPNLAIVCHSGVVGVDPDGAMEAVEHAEMRDTVHGVMKLEDSGGEIVVVLFRSVGGWRRGEARRGARR